MSLRQKRTITAPDAPTGRLVGYARVSTDDQSLDLQTDALTRAGVPADAVYTDKASGVSSKRPGLDLALMACAPGDTLVVWKLDRFGRSLLDLLARMKALDDRGVGFRSLTEGIDTTTPGGRLILHVMGALAQFERDLIVERTRAGIVAAKARGTRFGRERQIDVQHVIRRFEAGRTMQEVADEIGVTRQGLHRYFKASDARAIRENYLASRRAKRAKR